MPPPVPPGWWSDRRGQDRVQWSLSAPPLTQCWGWSRHYITQIAHLRHYPSPYTVSKHHKPPRRDGRSQVTAGQLRSDVSSAESFLSPPIKTDIVTLPLMYVNETLSAASPVSQFSSSHLRTGLSLSDCRDVGVGFQ